MKRLNELRARRERLVATAAMHREAMAVAMDGLRTPLLLADKVVAAAAYVRRRPMLLAGAAAATVVIFRLPQALRFARRGFAIWRSVRAAGTLLTAIRTAISHNITERMGRSA